MKKKFILFATIGVAACCFGACKSTEESSQYDALNALLDKSYSQIVINVTDTFDAYTVLSSEYRMSYSDDSVLVQYSVEEFAEPSLDDTASSHKTTLKGEATIKNGAVTFTGDEVPLSADIATPAFTFKEDYFTNATLTDTSLVADVSTPSGFMGTTLNCTNMKVQAVFSETAFSSIQISYASAGGGRVKYAYSFTV